MTSFEPFGLSHGLAAGLTLLGGVSLPWAVARFAAPRQQDLMRRALVACMAGYILGGPLVRAGLFDQPLGSHLPLHLCGASIIFGAAMLWFRSQRIYEFVYFWGTGGTTAALLTPDLQNDFPHPLFLLFFVGHGLGFLGAMFATLVLGFRPRARSIGIAFGATALYAAAITPVNILLGSNYLYLMRKPSQPSPLDLLGPWPWYIAPLGLVVLLVMVLLYLPFAFRRRPG